MPFLLGRPVLSGLLLIDKPAGPTSHDAVLWARRVLNTKDVGHCGSLDPLATGLLLLILGESLSQQNRFMAQRKVYEGTIRLGLTTDTDDISGKTLAKSYPKKPEDFSEKDVGQALKQFSGVLDQKVPLYSAVKLNGKPLYFWARQGTPVDCPTKSVEVHSIDLLAYTPPEVRFRVACSKGFYVRSLARDLGKNLGTGGTLASLCRESIGPYERKYAYPWQDRAPLDVAELEKAFIPAEKLPD